MLKRFFDIRQVYKVVLYLRMSTEQQNKRSPKQQKDTINRCIKSLKLPWKIVKIYTDEAKTGRLLRNRPGYQQMMREIKSGVIKVDLILVDTIERFGRVEELPTIRKDLDERYGVLVLTADTHFADPNSPQGRTHSMVESMRATEDGRVKAHNVLRGKLDAAEQKHWPGGPTPFGFMLKSVMKTVKGREEVDYCLLIPDPESAWIIKRLFAKAEETGWGTTRLACALNNDPEIPAKFKPFQPETVGYWLDNEIYYGDLVWAKNCTGIVDDARVIEPNKPEDVIRVVGFCEALIEPKQWASVQSLREARRRKTVAHTDDDSGRLIQGRAPGVVLRYLLTGLVCCGLCRRSMTPSSSSPYEAKDGIVRRYVSYVCPGFIGGHCANDQRVPEEWLREVVVNKLRNRLFPSN